VKNVTDNEIREINIMMGYKKVSPTFVGSELISLITSGYYVSAILHKETLTIEVFTEKEGEEKTRHMVIKDFDEKQATAIMLLVDEFEINPEPIGACKK
jgi:hypothetical protein